jgi:hypothetical protein
VRLLGSRFANVVDAAVGAVRNLSTPESYSVYKALFKAGVSTMLVHVVAHSTNPACKQNALKILLDLASAALDAPSAPSAPSTPTAESPAHAQADEYTASNAIDRLVQRSLPSVLIELLHKDTPPSLQARAMTVLLLLASQKPQVCTVVCLLIAEHTVPVLVGCKHTAKGACAVGWTACLTLHEAVHITASEMHSTSCRVCTTCYMMLLVVRIGSFQEPPRSPQTRVPWTSLTAGPARWGCARVVCRRCCPASTALMQLRMAHLDSRAAAQVCKFCRS